MSAPREAWFVQPVRIRSERRLAAGSELNPAPGRVTGHREARGMGYRATTQVKGLSPEIPVIPVADAVHYAAGNTLRSVMRGAARPAGSETVARYQMDESGTRETHDGSRKGMGQQAAYQRQGGSDGVMGVGPAHSSDEAGQCLWSEGAGRTTAEQGHFFRTQNRAKEVNKTRLHDLLDGG